MAELFGFRITRANQSGSSDGFTAPSSDDGTLDVVSGGGHYASILDMDGRDRNELDLIRRYRDIAQQPECDSAIEDIANEAIVSDERGQSVSISLDRLDLSKNIKSKIRDEFNEVLVVSNNLINFKQSEKVSLIQDFKKDLGPLGGVLTAMKWVKDNDKDYQWISTFPADTPFFKNHILKNFLKKINMEEGKLFFIKSNNTRHNIFGLWSIDLMEKLEEDLDKGERKVEVWAAVCLR